MSVRRRKTSVWAACWPRTPRSRAKSRQGRVVERVPLEQVLERHRRPLGLGEVLLFDLREPAQHGHRIFALLALVLGALVEHPRELAPALAVRVQVFEPLERLRLARLAPQRPLVALRGPGARLAPR